MALELVDLRRAAIREYPELRPLPEPEPGTWWQLHCWQVITIAVLAAEVILAIVLTITRT